jgi:hypothetical protein
MFCPLDYKDTLLIGRGLLILIVAIAVGVSVTEQQLNSLTEWQECIQIFDMSRENSGIYSLNILGYDYRLTAVIPVAEIVNQDMNIDIKTSAYTIYIPKIVNLDCRKELIWLTLQVKWLEKSIIEEWQKINVYIRQLR